MCVLSSSGEECATLYCWYFELKFSQKSCLQFWRYNCEGQKHDTCQVIVMVNLLCPDIVSRSLCVLGIAVFILYTVKVMAQALNSLPKLLQLVSCGAPDFNWDLLYIASHVFCIMLLQSLSVTMICFFCRQNPETTFEVYVEVAYPRTGGTLSGTHLSNYDSDVSSLYGIAVHRRKIDK